MPTHRIPSSPTGLELYSLRLELSNLRLAGCVWEGVGERVNWDTVTITKLISWLLDQLKELMFPKRCVGCGKGGEYVCQECEVGMWEAEQVCPACGKESQYGLVHKYCKDKTMDGLTCVWAYEGMVKRLITKSKSNKYHYDYLKELARKSCGSFDAHEFLGFKKFLKTNPVIIPVPLYPKQKRQMGFSPAEMVALELGRKFGVPVAAHALVRIKESLDRDGRLKAGSEVTGGGRFVLNPKAPAFEFKSVLLVDDVWTFEPMLPECASVLRTAGVKFVWGWTLVRQ